MPKDVSDSRCSRATGIAAALHRARSASEQRNLRASGIPPNSRNSAWRTLPKTDRGIDAERLKPGTPVGPQMSGNRHLIRARLS